MTRPIQRRAARVLLVDERGRVLLFRGFDPGRPRAGTWWFTPGGGVEGNESSEEAARRELFEETGFRVAEMGAVVLRRHVDHEFEGRLYSQEEEFFWVGCGAFPVNERGWTPTERQVVVEHRWWPRSALRRTAEPVYPVDLANLLDRLERSSLAEAGPQ